MKFTKKDFWGSVFTGLTTGFIGFLVADFLGVPRFAGLSFGWLVAVVPVLWIAGVYFGFFLGRFLSFMNQFGKFAAVGFTNFAVDLGVLNLEIAQTGQNRGVWYAVFAGVSFCVASLHSYFWNRVWVFDGSSRGGAGEFVKFFVVTVASLAVNIAVAASIVNFLPPQFGLSANQWASAGKIAGSAVALIASFLGFRLVVFKKS